MAAEQWLLRVVVIVTISDPDKCMSLVAEVFFGELSFSLLLVQITDSTSTKASFSNTRFCSIVTPDRFAAPAPEGR